jgi:Replication-relaxation
MLAEHTALTTGQVVRLGFAPSVAQAQQRLLRLTRRDWIGKVRLDADIENSCWLLDAVGLDIFGSRRPHRSRRQPIPDKPALAATVRTNDFFVELASHARTHPGDDLRQWWSPTTCYPLVSPRLPNTSYAEYVHHGRRINFWYEHDDETASPAELTARLLRYRAVLLRTGLGTVLMRMATSQRESNLQWSLLGEELPALTVATINPERSSTAPEAWWVHRTWEFKALHELPENPEPHFATYGPDGWPPLAPWHPIHDYHRPSDDSVVDGEYSYSAVSALRR